MDAPKDATAATRAALARAAAALPPEDGADFERVRRGFIDTLPDARIESPTRGVAWDLSTFAFEAAEAAPDTVHPGLWRQARLNLNHGLFKVTDGVYQVRGFDISNVTFIEGERGYVVIDPLTTAEPAAAALALMRQHRGDKPVTAVIYTHSHVDHYGGVMGVLTEADIAAGARIIAPEGFLIEAVSENVLLGNVMNRRATYMYGALLPRGPKGHVDAGLGKAVSLGQPALVAPTESIVRTGTRLSIDGVEAVFQVTPGTEAPAEMNFYFPRLRALCMAENCTCCLHNLYTPRGAQVRDAKAWSFYIDEAIDALRRRRRRALRQPPLAALGPPRCRAVPDHPARPLQVRPRPDAEARQPRPDPEGDRRGRWRCRRRWRPSGTRAATTARSTTTPRRSTSATSAGSTAIRRTCIRCRRPKPASATWTSRAGPRRSSPRRARRSRPATTAGWPRW